MDLQFPPQQPPSKVPRAAVQRAVTALIKWKSSQPTSESPQLLPSDDEFLYLVLTLTKTPPKTHINSYKIPLSHPLYTPKNSKICLFIGDKSNTHIENLPVSKIIKLSKLKKDYKSNDQKKVLCESYDLFLAEKKITPLLPNVIGKEFYKKKKVPVAVELSKEGEIEGVCKCGMLNLSSGSCSSVRIGRASMGIKEIVDNVIVGIEGVVRVIPKKWRNVRGFHLKFSESLALPVYEKVLGLGVDVEEVGKKKRKIVDEDETKELKKSKVRV